MKYATAALVALPLAAASPFSFPSFPFGPQPTTAAGATATVTDTVTVTEPVKTVYLPGPLTTVTIPTIQNHVRFLNCTDLVR